LFAGEIVQRNVVLYIHTALTRLSVMKKSLDSDLNTKAGWALDKRTRLPVFRANFRSSSLLAFDIPL